MFQFAVFCAKIVKNNNVHEENSVVFLKNGEIPRGKGNRNAYLFL